MSELRQFLENYVQEIQSILKGASDDDEIISMAKDKWFDRACPKNVDPRLSVFISASRRLSIPSENTSGSDAGGASNEVLQPSTQLPK